MPEDLIPVSREDLVSDVRVHAAAMRARGEDKSALTQFFAERLVDRLLQSGLVPFRRENRALYDSAHAKWTRKG